MSYQTNRSPPGTQVVRNAKELEKIQILERRKFAIDCIEFYYKQLANGTQPSDAALKASIKAFFIMVAPSIQVEKNDKYTDIRKIIDNERTTPEQYIDLFYDLNSWCYLKGFRWDDMKIYDSQNVEEENEAFQI